METINYSEVKELGFVREEINDDVFFNQYGFDYFLMTKKVTKKIILDWDCNTRLVKLIRVDKQGNIKGTLPINSLAHLKNIIGFFAE